MPAHSHSPGHSGLESHPHAHAHPADGDAHGEAFAELLDLDAKVLHAHLEDVTSWVSAHANGSAVRRILDVGSGTGTGSFALLARFPDANAIAVDASPFLLSHARHRAEALGLADRFRPVEADLDVTWPAIEPVDLVWASASLHHLADPGRVLAEIRDALHPGGRLAVVEMDAFPRFLPDDLGLGRPGLEERCHALADARRAEDLPYLGADWGSRLVQAGFAISAERSFAIELTPPLPTATGRYAQLSLRRVRDSFQDQLSAEDLAVLDTVLADDGPDSVLHRTDLTVRAVRTAWLARRP